MAFQLSSQAFWLRLRDTPSPAAVADLSQRLLATVHGIENDQLLKIHTMHELLQTASQRAEEILASETDQGILPSKAADGLIRTALDEYFRLPPGTARQLVPEPEPLPAHLRIRIREDARGLVASQPAAMKVGLMSLVLVERAAGCG